MASTVAMIDTGHADMIHDAQMDYYGKRIATCSSDRSIRVYDLFGEATGTPTLTAELAVHEGPVWMVSWSHPRFGSLIASCGYDRRAVVSREVSPGSWVAVYKYEDHASSVNAIAWSPQETGLHLAAASSDGKVTIHSHRDDHSWSVATLSDCPTGVNAVSWAPAHHTGASPSSSPSPTGHGEDPSTLIRRIATGGCDSHVRVYALRPSSPSSTGGGASEWRLEASLPGHGDWVRDVAWSPISGLAGNVLASCSEDGSVIIWRQEATGGQWSPTPLPPFPSPVWRLSWNSTGHLLAVTCGDASVTLWREGPGGRWVQVSTVPDPAATGAHPVPPVTAPHLAACLAITAPTTATAPSATAATGGYGQTVGVTGAPAGTAAGVSGGYAAHGHTPAATAGHYGSTSTVTGAGGYGAHTHTHAHAHTGYAPAGSSLPAATASTGLASSSAAASAGGAFAGGAGARPLSSVPAGSQGGYAHGHPGAGSVGGYPAAGGAYGSYPGAHTAAPTGVAGGYGAPVGGSYGHGGYGAGRGY